MIAGHYYILEHGKLDMRFAAVMLLILVSFMVSAQQGWQLRTSGLPSPPSFNGVTVLDSQNVWIAGGGPTGYVFRSTDGANSWIDANPFSDSTGIPSTEWTFSAIAALSPLEAVVASISGRIFKTADGGLTWSKVFDNPSVTTFFNDLEMLNDSVGYAMGDAPNSSSRPGFVKTTDGGWTWTFVNNNLPLGSLQIFRRTDFISTDVGWTYASNSGLYKTTDGGTTWTRVHSVISGLNTVFFLSDSIGFYTQAGVNKSTDGGITWRKTLSTSGGIEFVRGTPAGAKLWAGGRGIYISTDLGETWVPQIVPTGAYLRDASFLDENVGTVVGDGAVLYTSTGGVIVSVEGERQIPESFVLRQNYPNPFNPSTTIRYELPGGGVASLTVYNILGQRVTTLIEGLQQPGTFEVIWDGHQVPSGVYYYQLDFHSENRLSPRTFRQTNTMVLIR